VTLPLEERAKVILDHAQRHDLRVLVETGSGDGITADALAPHFDRVFTIEVSAYKYYGVWGRLLHHANVLPILGDSADILPHLLNHMKEPAIYWLDGHYDGADSGRGREDTPIRTELAVIFAKPRPRPNVVLIDDARLFGTDPAYPDIGWITGRVDRWCCHGAWPPYEVSVADDIIRIVPLDLAST
jgi:hypothetical protein